jgi:hypothetical protein
MELFPFVFLLGGHDIEMIEIRKILSSNNILCFDNNLQWNNAQLSQYKNVLNDHDFFVGVELITDLDPPEKYTLIDHHNENAGKPSAIEQVATLLEIKLTRDQQLVAANDRGYIPTMLEMGATPEEIAGIRRRDREAQGVTDEDERLSEESIRENLSVEKGITVVKSLTSRFSTITDRLYPCDRLLIYTDTELTYYGEGVSQLIRAFDDLIKLHKAYSGGGETGFFGLTEEGIKISGSKSIVNQIINLLENGK